MPDSVSPIHFQVSTGPLPASRKIYVPGTQHADVKVAMREIDLEPIQAALAARRARDARASELFRRLESWRDRLINEGEPALAELARWHPEMDVRAMRLRVEAARVERQRTGASAAASRELFRALRAMFATMPG